MQGMMVVQQVFSGCAAGSVLALLKRGLQCLGKPDFLLAYFWVTSAKMKGGCCELRCPAEPVSVAADVLSIFEQKKQIKPIPYQRHRAAGVSITNAYRNVLPATSLFLENDRVTTAGISFSRLLVSSLELSRLITLSNRSNFASYNVGPAQ